MWRQIIVITLLFGAVVSHQFSFQSCPKVKAMPDFNLNQFVGKWFIIETLGSINTCQTMTFARAVAESTISVTQQREFLPLKSLNIKSKFEYEGEITLDDKESASMTVRWSRNIIGPATLYILDTDYSNYALMFECQKLFRYLSRKSITILSRSKTLENSTIDALKEKLKKQSLDTSSMRAVSQKDCDSETAIPVIPSGNEETLAKPPALKPDVLDAFKMKDIETMLESEIPLEPHVFSADEESIVKSLPINIDKLNGLNINDIEKLLNAKIPGLI